MDFSALAQGMGLSSGKTSILVRWYVSRLVSRTKESSEPKTFASMIITPAKNWETDHGSLESLIDAKADNLSWWSDDESDEIDGIIESANLEEGIQQHSARRKAGGQAVTPEKPDRKIVEGMVFVQMLPDRGIYSEFKKSHDDSDKLTELSELARAKGSTWLDFTVQARELTGEVYANVMGGREETGDATE